ncbi:hypothetical protein NUACC21_39100 [Scytonema sp. NUACC21]
MQADASFCGQCGYNLRAAAAAAAPAPAAPTAVAATVAPDISEVPPLVVPDPLAQPQPLTLSGANNNISNSSPLPPTAVSVPDPQFTAQSIPPSVAPPPSVSPQPVAVPEPAPTPTPDVEQATASAQPPAIVPPPPPEPAAAPTPPPAPAAAAPSKTQLQQTTVRLLHIQTDREVELPLNLSVIHMGKPNDRIPPDIDVSGFPNSEIVSRIHADIRVEGDAYYIEDVGSSNGTYINNLPLLPGNRHRLRPGDRISLGKGDLVTFLFQIS